MPPTRTTNSPRPTPSAHSARLGGFREWRRCASAISSSADGVTWEPWRITHADTHRPDPDRAPGRADRYFAELLHLPTSSFIRCKVVDHDGRTVPAPPDLRLVYIDGSLGPNLANQRSGGWDNATSMPKVIARAQWGCDEKLRFDAKGKEIWEPEYLVNEKIIVHHTDTPNDGDPAAAVRSVYYYHAITQGWGDIGYNFLIDRNGNVYEGRFGGENVVAGHALRYNYGSVGIALLGAFAGAPAPSPRPRPHRRRGPRRRPRRLPRCRPPPPRPRWCNWRATRRASWMC
ncbi:MAG: N-acetylmuramoyl-L-alanine amidase [Chloroflexia bacterium]